MGVNLFPRPGGVPGGPAPGRGRCTPPAPRGWRAAASWRGEILNQFFAFYPHLEEKPFFQAYRDRSLVLGREVTVLERGQTRTALALDLNLTSPSKSERPTGGSGPWPPGRSG